jgi:nickel/cobalt transporter (NicO) family protein
VTGLGKRGEQEANTGPASNMNVKTLTWLYLPTAFVLGMAHALEPGHSKTVVASYLISIKGRISDAILLGLTVTVAHTLIIFMLAGGVIILGAAFPLAQVQHWLEVVSALLVFVMGLWLVRARVREWRRERTHQHLHEHGHEHDHDHDHGHAHALPAGQRLSPKQLVSFGLAGGLVPCPAALAVFILAVGAGRPVLGLATVVVFSVGLALTLIGIGIAVCRGFALFEKRLEKATWTRRLPIISSLVVTVLGLVMLIKALWGHGHVHSANNG